MYITPSTGSSAQQAKRLLDLEEKIQELKDTGIYFEEVKPLETSNRCTDVAFKVPERSSEVKQAALREMFWTDGILRKIVEPKSAEDTVKDMTEVMEIFRGLVKDDEHRASTTSH